MRRIDLKKYNNLLDTLKLTDLDIIGKLSTHKVEFFKARNERVEWGVSLPTFIPPFYNFIKSFGDVPTQEAYYNFYINQNAQFFIDNDFNDEEIEGIKARLYRTYPSLVRDLHFSTFLKSRLTSADEVIYNMELDMEEGIDILIAKGEKKYGINLFTETRIARKGRFKKSFKHEAFDDVEYVDLPVTIGGSPSISNFYLYGLREMIQIEQLIND